MMTPVVVGPSVKFSQNFWTLGSPLLVTGAWNIYRDQRADCEIKPIVSHYCGLLVDHITTKKLPTLKSEMLTDILNH